MSVIRWFAALSAMTLLAVMAFSSGATLQAAESAAAIELAQRGPGDFMQRAVARFDSMCVYVGMDDKQKKGAKAAFDEMQDEMGKMRDRMQSGSVSREGIRDEMEKINQNYQKKLEALLNADQKAKLVKWNEDHPRRMGGRRG